MSTYVRFVLNRTCLKRRVQVTKSAHWRSSRAPACGPSPKGLGWTPAMRAGPMGSSRE